VIAMNIKKPTDSLFDRFTDKIDGNYAVLVLVVILTVMYGLMYLTR